MKKRILFALVLFLLLAGCSNTESNQEATQSAEGLSLRIATMPALETFPIFIAYDQGFFEDEGLTVTLERFFSPRDRDIAFQTDERIDGMTFDLVQLAIYQEAGIDLVATTSTIGLAALIGGEGVYEVADLQGLGILMTSNTSMDYILDRALTAGGLTMDDIITYEVPALPTRLEMLLHNQAAAAILPDPFSAMALEAGYNLVITTADLGINPFVLAFRREVTEEKLPELQAFYRAMNRAVAFLNTADRETFIDALLETVGYPEHVRDTLAIPVFPPYVLPTAAVVQDVLDFVRARGLLSRDIAVEDIIFDIGN